jgi:hypothetical protein
VLQNFPQQFYHGQHESRKTVFDVFWIGVDALRQRTSERVQRYVRGGGRTYRIVTAWFVRGGDGVVAFGHRSWGC